VPLRLMLLGMGRYTPTIETSTINISSMGLSMQLQVTLSNGSLYMHAGEKPVNLIPYLVLVEKEVALEMILPPHNEKIRGKGKVIWYDFGPREETYFFTAGIFLKEMESKDRKRWEGFVRDTGSFIKLAIISKIGFFFSLTGFIGFVLGWWRHRSFMLFKRFQWF
jgi:hypothetical protein